MTVLWPRPVGPLLLTIPFFVGVLMLPRPCIADDYYVKPSVESECPSGEQPCKTLGEYANETQNFSSDMRMLFLAGVHRLNRNLTFNQQKSVQMIPESAGAIAKIQLQCCDMVIDSVSSFIIDSMGITGAEDSRSMIMIIDIVKLNVSVSNFSKISLHVRRESALDGLVTITLQHSLLEQSSQSGLQITDKRSPGTLTLTVVNTSLLCNGQGGINAESSATFHVNIQDSIFKGNQITSSGDNSAAAAGLGIHSAKYDTQITIRSTHFISNQDLRSQPVIFYVSRAVSVEVFDSEFRDNRGTAIRVANVDQKLRLLGNVVFLSNSAQQGGALALFSPTEVGFMPGANVTFANNFADDVGGAIFVESASTLLDTDDRDTVAKCFYQFPAFENQPVQYTISFINNSANNGGNHLYGASMMSNCIVYQFGKEDSPIRSIDQTVRQFFHYDNQSTSPISSNPSRVCVIDHATLTSDTCTNIDQMFKTLTTFPGEEFNIDAMLVGAEFGAGTGSVYAQFLPTSPYRSTVAKLFPYQHSQRVYKIDSAQKLNYSVFSNAPHVVLVLAATDGTILTYGDRNQISQAVRQYESTRIVPAILLTSPVYVNVTLRDCPLGFYLDSTSLGCTCNPKLCSDSGNGKFSNGTGLIYVGESIWVNAFNSGNVSGIIMHRNCPFDYCSVHSDGIDLGDPDAQCATNHAGVLCGQCAHGFSLAIGSNKCLPCSNNDGLALFIFFAAAGFLLVLFIKILNMTVSEGTINGLVFYANVVWAYQNIFFPDASLGKNGFFYTFVAWINLDFGIQTCFIEGLTAYAKTWLQFLFPLYIWAIAIAIILVAHVSPRMTRLFGTNSDRVLATLFLLSYAKLLRTTITILVPATLYVYTDDGQPVKSETRIVWAFDGNLLYGRFPHVLLLLVALLVVIPLLLLPYTFVLLLMQPLRRYSHHRCLRWVNRMKPFFDAYVGPLNATNQFWVGLLLLARFVLMLTFILTYSDNPSASLLTLVIVIVFLFLVLSYTGRVYDHPTRFESRFLPRSVSFCSILEVSFLFNLVIVGVCVLYIQLINNDSDTQSKEVLVGVSVGIASLQFLGIVVYHSVCALKITICKLPGHGTADASDYQDLENRDNASTPITTSSLLTRIKGASGRSTQSGEERHKSYESDCCREPMLTESSA